MSNALLNLVWPIKMSATQKIVLVALADAAKAPDHPTKPGQCWLSMANLMARTCLCDRAIQKALGWLAVEGHIIRLYRPGHGVLYFVDPRTTFAPNEVHPDPQAGTPEPASGKSESTQKEEKKSERDELYYAPDWVPQPAWRAFVDMRLGMRDVPFTSYARDRLIEKLQRIRDRGHDVNEVLDAAIIGGHRDVIEPSQQRVRQSVSTNGRKTAPREQATRDIDVKTADCGPPAARRGGEARSLGAVLRTKGFGPNVDPGAGIGR